ncbi:YncE family protein [Ancylobacter vacuolatus]|uniref:Uncharacterized protein n=1 Tax=Ancylobacter vacuolatus TaxID=223389 RepID=A0ABU0DL19_9HYPH|nr:hypothetical protein [Ancylobacter vacuolatus]MDQ0349125.1 hypothetical protein [Ancylobacter vacuolatus]
MVDIDAALDPACHDTDRAVVARPRVTPDLVGEDGTGLPARDRLLVVNHTGATAPQAIQGGPHGHAGAVALFDLRAILSGEATAPALLLATGTFGPVDCVVAPDGRPVLAAAGEGAGLEDGGYRISVIDLEASALRHNFEMPHAGDPCPHPSPDEGFGGFPNPAGLALARGAPDLVLTADGGSGTVSVFALADVLAGGRHPPLARVAVPSGPFGIAASPDGAQAVVANRECPRTGAEGNSVSFLDLAALRRGEAAALVHVVICSEDGQPSRPMGVAFAPSGAAAAVLFIAIPVIAGLHLYLGTRNVDFADIFRCAAARSLLTSWRRPWRAKRWDRVMSVATVLRRPRRYLAGVATMERVTTSTTIALRRASQSGAAKSCWNMLPSV